MRQDAKRGFDWSGRIEHLEDRLAMSADPLGGAVELHSLLEEPPALEHHLESTPDFWIDPSDGQLLEDQLQEIEQALAGAHNLTGLTSVRNTYGFTGVGQTVAVIDSGIAYDHFALGGGFGGNYRVVGGWDFTGENDANPYDDGPEGSHGTHVAGIVGASGGTHTGVAPGVDLVGLRVFDDSGAGFFSWVENALRWVHDNRNNYESPITAVNLSLGTSYNADTAPNWSTMEDEFALLEADGIFIAVSAGNSFTTYNTPGLSYPAASSHVVPVMSVDDDGQLSYYSQRHTRAIAAPGRTIVSTVPDYAGNYNGVPDDYASYSGTSMASPYVAGASVIIRQAMEFAGYANVTQETIYDHMQATADAIFDSATNQWYNRLNMSAAINALMPADDYGSTSASAYDLGTLGSSRELSGVISTLSDVDYFRFTAGTTGTVTYAASNLTHELEAAWFGAGQASGSNNEFYTIDVTAGQAYTVGFSSSGGLGYYDFEITSESAFNYTDWGNVAFTQLEGLSLTGENWYRIESTAGGYLSVESLYNASGGTVTLGLYSSNMQQLSSGNAVNGASRVDVYSNAGEQYYLCVLGTNSDVDFRLSNLVSITGTTVQVAGTAGNDVFSFTAGSTHRVSVNGVSYDFAANSITGVNFTGGAGNDAITMTGTSANEAAYFRVGDVTFQGSGFSARALGVENVTINSGGGNDERAHFYDSAGNDTFVARVADATLSGTGYVHRATGFARAIAYASAGGSDTAYFYDSAGIDKFIANAAAQVSYMQGVGYYNVASGFGTSYAYSSGHTLDRAYFLDSTGNDLYVASGDGDYAYMQGAGYYHHARGFNYTYGFSEQGGSDNVVFYGSAGNDRLTATPMYFTLTGSGFSHRAIGFSRATAYAGTGSDDRAEFYDGIGIDKFIANASLGLSFMYSVYGYGAKGFYNVAQGFDRTFAYSNYGTLDRAYFYDSAGDDQFYARAASDDAYMQGPGYYNYAKGFSYNYAYSTAGGNDTANYTDSVGNDAYYVRAAGNDAYMRGVGYYNYSQGFKRVEARADQGGNDQLYLYDSAGNDALQVRDLAINLTTESGLQHSAYGFEHAELYSVNGGTDTADVDAADYAFDMIGSWN